MLQGVGAVRQVPMGWEVAHWAKEFLWITDREHRDFRDAVTATA